MQSRTVGIGELRVRWEEYGEGLPVVLIHGIPTSPRLWRHVVPRLSGCRALAWEMVGYGASIEEGKECDISVGRQSDYLIDWMDAVELRRAVLVGHDLGGGVAQIAAVRHPERVQGLVLINSISYDSWPVPSVKMLRALGPRLARSPNMLLYLIMAMFMVRGHDDLERAWESLQLYWRHYASADGIAAFVRQIQSLDVSDTMAIAPRLPELRVPARIVWGAADRFQKMRYADRLARNLGAPIDGVRIGKHYIPEDYPEFVAAAIRGITAELQASA